MAGDAAPSEFPIGVAEMDAAVFAALDPWRYNAPDTLDWERKVLTSALIRYEFICEPFGKIGTIDLRQTSVGHSVISVRGAELPDPNLWPPTPKGPDSSKFPGARDALVQNRQATLRNLVQLVKSAMGAQSKAEDEIPPGPWDVIPGRRDRMIVYLWCQGHTAEAISRDPKAKIFLTAGAVKNRIGDLRAEHTESVVPYRRRPKDPSKLMP